MYSNWNQLSFHRYGKLTCIVGSQCYFAIPQLWESCFYPQPKQVLDLATSAGCKAELTYVTWKRTGRELNPRPVNLESNALPLSHHSTSVCVSVLRRWCITVEQIEWVSGVKVTTEDSYFVLAIDRVPDLPTERETTPEPVVGVGLWKQLSTGSIAVTYLQF